jgi:hypothetical protein
MCAIFLYDSSRLSIEALAKCIFCTDVWVNTGSRLRYERSVE